LKRFIIPIFISNKGCKHRCIFCNQFNISSDLSHPEKVKNIVKDYLKTQYEKYGSINPKYEKSQISFYGGSFTCLEKDLMVKYLSEAFKFVNNNLIDSLRLSTRPDCINGDTVEILKNYKVETVEIGAQTFNDRLLKILNRGHTVQDILNSVKILKQHLFEIGIQVMVGLPEETEENISELIDILINQIKPDFIRIYPLLVVKGTILEKFYINKKFQPLSTEKTIKRCKKIFQNCLKNDIEVIRIGLQDNELLKSNIIAGPYIPNIGELVRKN
jgi:histone acetyltransferase (RNA polymerase elongator complex component)